MDYVAGEYVQQYEYKSFSPTTINHTWEISDGEVLNLLSDADRALGELNAFSQLVPHVDFFIQMHIAKEATQSTRIEGTQTNMEEAFLEEQEVNPEKRDDWKEVRNYIAAIHSAVAQLEHLPLSNRLLKEVHKVLMQGVRGKSKMPGEFRSSQNWIGISLKHAAFVPPHQEQVADLMSDLEKFLHNDAMHLPHLIRIAIAHYQFETIHPFLDGNGRLGRLMIALYLASNDLLTKPALYLSDFFERHKTQYVDHLMAVREGNHLKAWIVFFLQGVCETARNSIRVFKNILKLKEQLEREVLPSFSTRRQPNAQKLMEHLYRQPVVNVKHVSKLLDVPANTASSLVRDFEKMGILQETTGNQRNRIFLFKSYMTIFYDQEEQA